MKNMKLLLILVIISLILYHCSTDLEKTGALLEVTPAQIRFTQKDSIATVTVKNMGNENLQWRIHSAPSWLIFTRNGGNIAAGIADTFTVTYQKSLRDTLVEYRDNIILASNVNSANILVIFQSEQPNLKITKTKLEFGLKENSQQFTVSNSRNGFLDWKAKPSVAWFTISPDTGHTGAGRDDTISVIINKDLLPEPGEYNGSIQIVSDANGPFGTIITAKVNVIVYYLGIDQANLRAGSKLIFPFISYQGNLIKVLTEIFIIPIGQKEKCHWEIITGDPGAIEFSEVSDKGSNCAKFSGDSGEEMTIDLLIRVTDAMTSSVEQHISLVSRKIEITDPEMVAISGGSFTMGDSWGDGLLGERPAHTVSLNAFQMGKFEITNEQFYQFVLTGGYKNKDYWVITETGLNDDTGWQENSNNDWYQPRYWSNSDTPWDTNSVSNQPDAPVIGISWYEAYAYCKWLGSITGTNYRLPTEAQWERSARGAGNGRKYPWGDTWIATNANWDDNAAADGHLYTARVGSFDNGKSPDGCYNLAGNVWEWCYDWYGGYEEGDSSDPMGPQLGDAKVVRGGSWNSISRSLRTCSRTKIDPQYANDNVGFRIAKW